MASLIPVLWCQVLGRQGSPVLVTLTPEELPRRDSKRHSNTALTLFLAEFAP